MQRTSGVVPRRVLPRLTRHRWMPARKWLAPVLLTLALSGCTLFRGRAPAREIAVSLSTSRSEAVRRTLAAFRDQGYSVRETPTSGTNPETEEFRHENADVVFRAEITGSGNSARVVFSGTYRERRLGGLMRGDEQPVLDSDDPLERELWARLNNLALMLRGANRSGNPVRPQSGSDSNIIVRLRAGSVRTWGPRPIIR
ncbi:MAG TPA: hypothetical protein VFZ21_03850 [Gemmatimonadaceae bacterium]|nr:hypothetical protein [Gemmatimonadaceae bacterium]